MSISDKTRERRGWLFPADIAEHLSKCPTPCDCRCKFCREAHDHTGQHDLETCGECRVAVGLPEDLD